MWALFQNIMLCYTHPSSSSDDVRWYSAYMIKRSEGHDKTLSYHRRVSWAWALWSAMVDVTMQTAPKWQISRWGSMHDVDKLRKEMIHVLSGMGENVTEFKMPLRITPNLKLLSHFWNFPFNIIREWLILSKIVGSETSDMEETR